MTVIAILRLIATLLLAIAEATQQIDFTPVNSLSDTHFRIKLKRLANEAMELRKEIVDDEIPRLTS